MTVLVVAGRASQTGSYGTLTMVADLGGVALALIGSPLIEHYTSVFKGTTNYHSAGAFAFIIPANASSGTIEWTASLNGTPSLSATNNNFQYASLVSNAPSPSWSVISSVYTPWSTPAPALSTTDVNQAYLLMGAYNTTQFQAATGVVNQAGYANEYETTGYFFIAIGTGLPVGSHSPTVSNYVQSSLVPPALIISDGMTSQAPPQSRYYSQAVRRSYTYFKDVVFDRTPRGLLVPKVA